LLCFISQERLKVFGFAKRYGGKIGRPKKTPKEKKQKENDKGKKAKDDVEGSVGDSPNSLDIFMGKLLPIIEALSLDTGPALKHVYDDRTGDSENFFITLCDLTEDFSTF